MGGSDDGTVDGASDAGFTKKIVDLTAIAEDEELVERLRSQSSHVRELLVAVNDPATPEEVLHRMLAAWVHDVRSENFDDQ